VVLDGSDRLLNPVFREFYSERDVVREERRLRTESTPTGAHQETINALFWEALPYRWPVIGFASDVEELSMPQAREYYHTWYGPGNLTGHRQRGCGHGAGDRAWRSATSAAWSPARRPRPW
jgi:hypothetical protein